MLKSLNKEAVAFVVPKSELLSLSFDEIKKILSDYNMVFKQSYYDERFDFCERQQLTHRVYKHYIAEEQEEYIDLYKRLPCSKENFYRLLHRSFQIILKNKKYDF